jgi:hypothetical protein
MWSSGFLLFPEKEAKSVVLLRRILWATNNPRSWPPTPWSASPRFSSDTAVLLKAMWSSGFLLFPQKEALFCFADDSGLPIIREADPGGLGLAPKGIWKRG